VPGDGQRRGARVEHQRTRPAGTWAAAARCDRLLGLAVLPASAEELELERDPLRTGCPAMRPEHPGPRRPWPASRGGWSSRSPPGAGARKSTEALAAGAEKLGNTFVSEVRGHLFSILC